MTVKTPVGNIKFETIFTLLVGAILIPSTGWLLSSVLQTQKDMILVQTNMNMLQQQFIDHCQAGRAYQTDHTAWSTQQMGALNTTLNRMDRNIVRLCNKTGTDYEEP